MEIIEISGIRIQPAEVFERVFKDKPFPFLLESGIRHPEFGRYSIMGCEPFLRFKSKGRKIEIIENGRAHNLTGNPFNCLKDLFHRFKRSINSRFLPFTGGAVGYFAYDLGAHIEKLPDIAVDDINLPDCYLCFYKNVFLIDHIQNKCFIIGNKAGEISKSLNKNIKFKKYNIPSQKMTKKLGKSGRLNSNFTYSGYIKAINKAKYYISCGDIYQVNLSQRFMCQIETTPFEVYKRLRHINPAPFSAFLDYGDFSVVSSSPERFLRVRDGIVQTRPIKGTRPRGRTPSEDRRLAGELLKSEKDRAELVMIVDLERNDLGRVCEYGSVRVKELVALEKYPTVFHTVATVEGKLYRGKDIIDLLKATFPGGSITGAPKIRAMEIIEELEPTKRSIYTGAIGYISFEGNMDLNIVIRTFILKGNTAYFQAGGGIVADSQPEAEYQETLDKAKALIETATG